MQEALVGVGPQEQTGLGARTGAGQGPTARSGASEPCTQNIPFPLPQSWVAGCLKKYKC